MNIEDRMLLTLKEVAKILRVSTRTVRRLIKSGDVKGFKIGGAWRVRDADIEALLIKGAGSAHAVERNNES